MIVVSDGSTDGTDEYLADIETPLNLRFLVQQNSGPAAARNNGFRSARGEDVLFIDDDVVPALNWWRSICGCTLHARALW